MVNYSSSGSMRIGRTIKHNVNNDSREKIRRKKNTTQSKKHLVTYHVNFTRIILTHTQIWISILENVMLHCGVCS